MLSPRDDEMSIRIIVFIDNGWCILWLFNSVCICSARWRSFTLQVIKLKRSGLGVTKVLKTSASKKNVFAPDRKQCTWLKTVRLSLRWKGDWWFRFEWRPLSLSQGANEKALFRVRAYSLHKLHASLHANFQNVSGGSSRVVKALIKDHLDDSEKLCSHSPEKVAQWRSQLRSRMVIKKSSAWKLCMKLAYA